MYEVLKVNETYRSTYVTLFCSILLFALSLSALIYYLVRHKKRFHFEVSGRKIILNTDEFPQLLKTITDIIIGDNKDELEKYVHRFSLGILLIKNEHNQSLLHLTAINGSLKCFSYITYFKVVDPHGLDNYKYSPLYYAIKHLKNDDSKNKEIISSFLKITDVHLAIQKDINLKEMINKREKNNYFIQNNHHFKRE